MKKSYTDKKTGIGYTQVGEIYLPNLVMPHIDREIGMWGERYRTYLKTHRKVFYTSFKIQCKLDEHLHEVDIRATEMYDRLVKQLAQQEGITEQLKADDMMAWVQAMNSICNRAREIVWNELVVKEVENNE